MPDDEAHRNAPVSSWNATLSTTKMFVPGLHRRVATVFFQGIGSSRAQAAKYTGRDGVRMPRDAGNAFVWNAPQLLYELHPFDELEDVGYGFTLNPLHWLTMLFTGATQRWRGMSGAPAYYIRPRLSEMAGPSNVALHARATADCIAANPTKKIVLFGTSRGAATTFISLSRMSPETLSRIAFVVLEGMPSSVDDVLEARSPFPDLSKRLFYSISAHDRDAPSPLDAAKDYPITIPTMFVTSKADTRVPSTCTERVIDLLRARGMKPMHLELQDADHSSFSTHNPVDQRTYYDAFRKLHETYV